MANVNLKTDFKDGEFLYADQLKNNFEAIQAALNAMNAIVWQDNADKVVTFRGTTEELMNREIIDGQILYDTTTGESYIDYLGRRISTGSGNAIHIGENEPTNPSTQIWINRDDLSAVGSEVVNSLDGNEERMAPSVAAVNEGLGEIVESVAAVNEELGEIVESGSNENGKWIKWADGTMICQKVVSGTAVCTKAWGSLFETEAISLGRWAQTFTEFHAVSITHHGTSNGYWLETSYGASTTSCGTVMFCRATEKEDLNWRVHIIGYGKWK